MSFCQQLWKRIIQKKQQVKTACRSLKVCIQTQEDTFSFTLRRGSFHSSSTIIGSTAGRYLVPCSFAVAPVKMVTRELILLLSRFITEYNSRENANHYVVYCAYGMKRNTSTIGRQVDSAITTITSRSN